MHGYFNSLGDEDSCYVLRGSVGFVYDQRGRHVDSANEELVGEILVFLREGPAHFEDILNRFQDAKYRDILRAWGVLRKNDQLGREMETGKYILKTVDSQ